MADTEEEQIEAIKKWLDENGTSLVVGIVVAVAGVFGFQSWQNSTRESGEAAAALYGSLTEAAIVAPTATLTEETIQSSRFIADTLKTDHGGTAYAQFAALLMAKLAVEDNDLELATRELEWVIEQGPDYSIEVIARIRLARVLLAGQRRDDALAQVEQLDAETHRARSELDPWDHKALPRGCPVRRPGGGGRYRTRSTISLGAAVLRVPVVT